MTNKDRRELKRLMASLPKLLRSSNRLGMAAWKRIAKRKFGYK
jgi:hypothetical protein